MNKPAHWRIARAVSLTFLIAATGTSAAIAQEAPPAPTQLDAGAPVGDPPGRVARLNYFDGTVTLEPAGASDWSYAELNRPMTTGDQVWVDNGGRSELHIGSTALRLGQLTALSIVNLDDQNAQLKVAQGTLETRVRELPPGQTFEIDTPNVALQANGPGIYRVDASPDGSSTTVTVRDGTLTAYGDNGSVQLGAGQQITFSGTNLQETGGGTAQGLDPFDTWAASRDRAEDGSVSARYVSRDVPGYQDLDANGSWEDSPDYGNVWVPRVEAGWAPYHQGHWAWVAPWGWTWVDDAPWGFAPFHYGRWAYWHDRWAWVPGPVVAAAPPCYSPALVAFVGGGNGGWNVSLAVGAVATAGVAWLALGPGEPWHPAYHYSPGYYSRVNYVNHTTIVNNTTIINNRFINRNVPGAVMGMPANQFVHGQDTRRYGQPMRPEQIQHASFGAGAPAIAPVRQSFGGALRPANYRPPQDPGQRQVVATRTPPTPFAYRDSLAQSFARTKGGTVAGAGQPVVRTAPPANFARGSVSVPGTPGRPGAEAPQAQARPSGQPGFRVVQSERRPMPESGQPGQPGRGAPPAAGGMPPRPPQGGQPGQPGQPGQQPFAGQARPGQPGQPGEPNGARGPAQGERPEQAQAPRDNGVPRPPSAMQQARPGQPGGAPVNAQQEQQQRAQQEQQQRGAMQGQQEQQQRAQQEQQQRGQQQAQQEQQQRAQQEQQQRAQQQAQQEQQQRAQQEQQQRGQQQAQQEQQQRAQQEQQQRAQQQAQQEQQQRAQQEQQQRAQQQAQQEQQQRAQQEQQQRAQQQAQQRQQQQAEQAQQQRQAQQEQQRQAQMQQMQQRQQQQQQQQHQQQQQQQREQPHKDQQSGNAHDRRDESHG